MIPIPGVSAATLKLIAIIALVAGVVFAFFWWGERQASQRETAVRAVYDLAIQKQKTEAARKLSEETEKTRALERALQASRNLQESRDATNKATVNDLAARLAAASDRNGGRLRDPNATGCRGGGDRPASAVAAAPASGDADASETGGLLSAQLSGLLQRLTREADDINVAYAACHADALNLRATINITEN